MQNFLIFRPSLDHSTSTNYHNSGLANEKSETKKKIQWYEYFTLSALVTVNLIAKSRVSRGKINYKIKC